MKTHARATKKGEKKEHDKRERPPPSILNPEPLKRLSYHMYPGLLHAGGAVTVVKQVDHPAVILSTGGFGGYSARVGME